MSFNDHLNYHVRAKPLSVQKLLYSLFFFFTEIVRMEQFQTKKYMTRSKGKSSDIHIVNREVVLLEWMEFGKLAVGFL